MDTATGTERDLNNNVVSTSPHYPFDVSSGNDDGRRDGGFKESLTLNHLKKVNNNPTRTITMKAGSEEASSEVTNSGKVKKPHRNLRKNLSAIPPISLKSTMSMPILCSVLWTLCFSFLVLPITSSSPSSLMSSSSSGSSSSGIPEPQFFMASSTNNRPSSHVTFPSDDDEDVDDGAKEDIQYLDRLSHRKGRVLTGESNASNGSESGSTTTTTTYGDDDNVAGSREFSTILSPLNSSTEEDNGSSRKASPDVQDIIDGIVKLLGGKVHNGDGGTSNNQKMMHRPLSSPNPYGLFNPAKPFFPPPQKVTPKPTRINNRGPVIPGQTDPASSFEAIPLEALNDDFDTSNFGPPFPISGNGGAIQNNLGGGSMEPPFKKGVPLPEMVVPQQQQHHQQFQGSYPQQNYGGQQQQQQQAHPHQQHYLQNGPSTQSMPYPPQQQQQHRPPQAPPPQQLNPPLPQPPHHNTRYQVGGNYNNYGFEQPQQIPHYPSSIGTPLPPSGSTVPSKRPIVKFPTDETAVVIEDDEEDEMRFTTPKPPPQVVISPTSSSSVPKDDVYPTLLLSTNKDNGLFELVSQYEDNKEGALGNNVRRTTTTTPPSSTSAGPPPRTTAVINPIYYPNNSPFNNNNKRGETSPTTVKGVVNKTKQSSNNHSGSSNPLSIHSLPTPPLRKGVVISDSPPTTVTHPSTNGGAGVGSVEIVTADEGQSLLEATQGNGYEPQVGDIFDVTVSANQNFGGQTTSTFQLPPPPPQGGGHVGRPHEVITTPEGTEQFVSIDGKRTYFNLHSNTGIGSHSTSAINPTKTLSPPTQTKPPTSLIQDDSKKATSEQSSIKNKNIGVGTVGNPVPLLPQPPGKTLFNSNTPIRTSPVSTSLSISNPAGGNDKPKTPVNIIRRPLQRRPTVPPVRIDTCIVGDDNTCNADQGEICRTESGVSSCVCRSGYARRRHREPCKPIYALVLSMKLDKLGDKKLNYNGDYFNPNTEIYQTIEWETIHALDTSLGETTLSPHYVGSKLDAIGFDGKHAVVNCTILMQENSKMLPLQLKKELQKQMIQVLTRHRNNFGKGQLWVEGPISAVAAVTDLNECLDSELNDCNAKANCVNTFGSFECKCEPGYGDPFEHDKRKSGRRCDSCSGKHYCNGRGECMIDNGQKVCKCAGNYYGSQCDIDGEVLAVAIGASISAVIIIGLTLVCLCMWSRKWKKEEQKAALMSRTLFGGMATQALSYLGGKANPYQQHVSLDERLRWAQMAESANMSGNIYVQNDPLSMGPPCAMGPQIIETHTPPLMTQRRSAETMDTTVMGEDLFVDERQTVKRPRSRAASQFQGSIYYDLEPEQTEIYASRSMLHFPPPPAQFCVPMTPMGHYATHTTGRGYYS